jgi:segregation and condensation protein B
MERDMTSGEADLAQEMIEVDTKDVEEGNRVPDERTSDPNRVQSRAELQAILESLLFVSSESLSVVRLTSVIGSVTKVEVEEALRGLGQALEQEGRGVRLAEIAGGYRIVTKQEYASWIKRLDKAKTAAKLSRSALESLAIIAYKQPLVRAEIEEIRGVETSGVLRTLLERKLVRIVGRKEVPGRPIMYGTTKFFLEHFGLNDLSQLPPLREFKELGEAEQSLLPIDGEMMPSEEESAEATTIDAIKTELEQSMIAEVENTPQLQEMFESLPVTS